MVSSSAMVIDMPPSPVKARTGSPGRATAAPIAAGTANAMVASPLEIRSRKGSETGHSGITARKCAPASTVVVMVSGSAAIAVSTSCTGPNVSLLSA